MTRSTPARLYQLRSNRNDLTGRGQFGHISLEVPLPALSLGRSGEGGDAADARVQRSCNPLDDATLARCRHPGLTSIGEGERPAVKMAADHCIQDIERLGIAFDAGLQQLVEI